MLLVEGHSNLDVEVNIMNAMKCVAWDVNILCQQLYK
jgi:hypothetical protein